VQRGAAEASASGRDTAVGMTLLLDQRQFF